jgi:AcrR family transcriptional regulator
MPRTKEAFESMRAATREKIEAAALSLFARKGLSVRVEEIAEAAGVSQGLMYSHFPSKDALIAGLARNGTEISSRAVMGHTDGEGTAAEKIGAISAMMCEILSQKPVAVDYFMFMMQAGMNGFRIPEASRYSDEFPDPAVSLARAAAQGQAEGSVVGGDPARLAMIYWAAVQGLCCYATVGAPVVPAPEMLNRILLKEAFNEPT